MLCIMSELSFGGENTCTYIRICKYFVTYTHLGQGFKMQCITYLNLFIIRFCQIYLRKLHATFTYRCASSDRSVTNVTKHIIVLFGKPCYSTCCRFVQDREGTWWPPCTEITTTATETPRACYTGSHRLSPSEGHHQRLVSGNKWNGIKIIPQVSSKHGEFDSPT